MGQKGDYKSRYGCSVALLANLGQPLRSGGASTGSSLLIPLCAFGGFFFKQTLNKEPSKIPTPVAMKPPSIKKKALNSAHPCSSPLSKSNAAGSTARTATTIGSVNQTTTRQIVRRTHAPAKKPTIRSVNNAPKKYMWSQIVADIKRELQLVPELCLVSKSMTTTLPPLTSSRMFLLPHSTLLWLFVLPTRLARDSQNWSSRVRRSR